MIQLQEIYDRIGQALAERNTPPPEVQQFEEQNVLHEQELEALQKQVNEHTEELREVRRKEEESQLELDHFQRQKAMVTNEREFTAVISEIDFATRARDEAAARRGELEALIATISTDLETRRATRPQEEAAQSKAIASWERRKKQLKAGVHDLATAAGDIEAQLLPANRARFLRLLESKKGTAMAQVIDGCCSVCHFALRPHLQQRVRRVQEIIACEHCHRVLYFPDMEELPGTEPDAG